MSVRGLGLGLALALGLGLGLGVAEVKMSVHDSALVKQGYRSARLCNDDAQGFVSAHPCVNEARASLTHTRTFG